MKRFYSVKEASDLLGVSTNTVYKYLIDGRIESRRIGKGRIKILASSLKPYINKSAEIQVQEEVVPTQKVVPQEVVQQQVVEPVANIVEKTVLNGGISGEQKPLEEKTSEDIGEISYNNNDRVIFRIFKSLSFIGLGVIFLITGGNNFSSAIVVNEGLTQIIITVFPFALLVGGFLGIVATLYAKVTRELEIVVHIIFTFILGYYTYASYYATNGALFIFTASLMLILVDHLIRGLTPLDSDDNFSSRFSKYLVAVFVIGGIFIMKDPSTYTVGALRDLIINNGNIVGFGWFGFFIPLMIYFASPLGKNSNYFGVIFIPAGILLVLAAMMFTASFEWGASYLSYLAGIFSLFLVVWKAMSLKINIDRFGIVLTGFVWTGVAVLLALVTINVSQNQLRKETESDIRLGASEVVDEVGRIVERNHSVIIPVAGGDEVARAIIEGDKETAIESAKIIYDQLEGISMVIVMNEEGIAVGVYPRNDMIQGTNFSGREYFIKTKESYKSYLSPAFTSVLNNKTVVHTEPIFEDNKFIGMVVVGMDLAAISQNFQQLLGSGYMLKIEDINGTSLFDNGEPVDLKGIDPKYSLVKVSTTVSNPEWKITITTTEVSLLEGLSSTLLFISVFLLINSLVSISAVLYYASRKDASEIIRGMKFPLTGIQGGVPVSKPQLA